MGKSQKLGNMPNAPAFSAYANAAADATRFDGYLVRPA